MTRPHRPWTWPDVRLANGWITPVGYISDDTIKFFTKPYGPRANICGIRIESDSTLAPDTLMLRCGVRELARIGDGPIARVDGGDPGDENDAP